MGSINLVAVVLGAVAFFAVGAIWYGPMFSKTWLAETGLSEAQIKASHMPKLLALTFVLELIVAFVYGHAASFTSSAYYKLMIAIGFGAFVMTPAIGINYLFQRRSLKLFLIDAGHFIVGTAAMGAVFAALG